MSARRSSRAQSEPAHAGQYVYSVIRYSGPLSSELIGIGPGRAAVHLVRHRALAAVVSATPLVTLEPTRDNVVAHERVNQRLLERHTLVPMSFGTVFKSRQDVTQLLRSAYDALSQALDTIDGNIELGLEVLWDVEREKRRLEQHSPALRERRRALTGGADDFAARLEYGQLMDAALQERADAYAADILAGLRAVSVAAKVSSAGNARIIFKAAFLVRRDESGSFERQLKAVDARHRKLTFRLTGPWPPYNFVSIRLQIAGEEGGP